jgi:hypothetical protein
MVISDTSGSMGQEVAGSIRAVDVSQALALYCSDRMPQDSPFWRRFIGFSSESKFKDWRKMTFSEAVHDRRIFDGAIGTTRVDTALNLILRVAKERSIPQSLMPTMLLIVSDMQFHQGASTTGRDSDTEIERCLKSWEEAGYEKPKVVYWNTSAYAGQQATKNMQNVGLISGFSPSILKAVLNGTDFTPMAIMMRTLAPYLELVREPENNS